MKVIEFHLTWKNTAGVRDSNLLLSNVFFISDSEYDS